jgi:all-trans-nonaprenyl-diphosphate synthase
MAGVATLSSGAASHTPGGTSNLSTGVQFVAAMTTKLVKSEYGTTSRDDDATKNIWQLVQADIRQVNSIIKREIDAPHPVLTSLANYYFGSQGKQVRPAIVALVAHALRGPEVTERDLRLGALVEMIHTASLVHDDVIDEADTRRGIPAINVAFSNKLAILCGDFLLARASTTLASLDNHDVTRIISQVLSDLVEGEILQMKASSPADLLNFDYYIKKTYLKTGSLICNAARAAAVLSGSEYDLIEAATDYGRHLGIAFQVIDDLLDFTGDAAVTGKPVGNDIKSGLSTAPTLFAIEEYGSDNDALKQLALRKFRQEGDAARGLELVMATAALEKTRKLAEKHVQYALDALSKFPESIYRDALKSLCSLVLTRDK